MAEDIYYPERSTSIGDLGDLWGIDASRLPEALVTVEVDGHRVGSLAAACLKLRKLRNALAPAEN
jgi:hypothetical protein